MVNETRQRSIPAKLTNIDLLCHALEADDSLTTYLWQSSRKIEYNQDRIKKEGLSKLISSKCSTTVSLLDHLQAILAEARENPDDPKRWHHVSYVMAVLELLNIDINNEHIRKWLQAYHLKNPDTVNEAPEKQKEESRLITSDEYEERETTKSAHETRFLEKSYAAEKQKQPKAVVKKTNEMQQAEFEAAMSDIYRLLLPVDAAPKYRAVKDQYGLVIGSYSVAKPLKTFDKLSRAELRAENLATNSRLAGILVSKYFMMEDDLHQENLDPNYVFDHDMSLWPVAIQYKGNVRGKEPEYLLTVNDIENFPDIKDAKPHYWPTKPEAMSHPVKGYFWSIAGRYICDQITQLKDNPQFNRDKYFYFLKASLITDQQIEQAVDAHISSQKMRKEIKLALMNRRRDLKQKLAQSPKYQAALLTYADEYHRSLLQEAREYNAQFKEKEKYQNKLIDINKLEQDFYDEYSQAAAFRMHDAVKEINELQPKLEELLRTYPNHADAHTLQAIEFSNELKIPSELEPKMIKGLYHALFRVALKDELLENHALVMKYKTDILNEALAIMNNKYNRISKWYYRAFDSIRHGWNKLWGMKEEQIAVTQRPSTPLPLTFDDAVMIMHDEGGILRLLAEQPSGIPKPKSEKERTIDQRLLSIQPIIVKTTKMLENMQPGEYNAEKAIGNIEAQIRIVGIEIETLTRLSSAGQEGTITPVIETLTVLTKQLNERKERFVEQSLHDAPSVYENATPGLRKKG